MKSGETGIRTITEKEFQAVEKTSAEIQKVGMRIRKMDSSKRERGVKLIWKVGKGQVLQAL